MNSRLQQTSGGSGGGGGSSHALASRCTCLALSARRAGWRLRQRCARPTRRSDALPSPPSLRCCLHPPAKHRRENTSRRCGRRRMSWPRASVSWARASRSVLAANVQRAATHRTHPMCSQKRARHHAHAHARLTHAHHVPESTARASCAVVCRLPACLPACLPAPPPQHTVQATCSAWAKPPTERQLNANVSCVPQGCGKFKRKIQVRAANFS